MYRERCESYAGFERNGELAQTFGVIGAMIIGRRHILNIE